MLMGTYHKDVICDNNRGDKDRRHSCKRAKILYTTETKLFLIQMIATS